VQARFTLLTTRDAVLPRLVTCMMTVRTSLPLGGCAPGPAPSLAEDPHLVARRQPLQSGRGDGMAEDHDAEYIFGLADNAALDALVAETAVNLRFIMR
jgi:hypothetical protein